MYSADFRRLAFTKYRKCRCIRETARLLEVSPSTMHRWIHDTWWGKTFVARKRMRRARKVSQCVDAAIEAYFDFGDPKNERMKIACIRSLQRYVKTETSIDLSLSTLSRCVQMHGISRKRLSTKVLGKVAPEKILEYKKRFDTVVMKDTLMVSLDECSFSEKVVPTYGYSRIGEKCTIRNQKGSWNTHSLILGIGSDGTSCHKICKGSVNRERFGEFVMNMPYLPGTVVLMDNCPIHYKLLDVFDAKGYTPLFLSPYSPDFQPVELAFSKIKRQFRSRWPWNDGVISTVEELIPSVSDQDVYGFFRHADHCLASAILKINSGSR